MEFIAQQAEAFPERAPFFHKLRDLHQKKLWFQLSEELIDAARDPFFVSNQRLVALYDGFVQKFEGKLSQLHLALFVVAASAQLPNAAAAQKFLAQPMETLKQHPEGHILCKLAIVLLHVKTRRLEDAKTLLDECKNSVEEFSGIVDARVSSAFYKAALEFHRVKGSAAEFYQNALLYLAYTPLESIALEDQVRLATDVGLAALVGNKIYNFSELLQHPIIKVLDGTEHEWLSQLLFAFNAGDIDRYQTIASQRAANQDILKRNASFLSQKIRIMCLMEMVFRRGSDSRNITFQEISETCRLPLNEVELLLMKAFSLKVLRGKIDQVEQIARIEWVQPRVLDKGQIGGMRDRLQQWSTQVQQTAIFLEANAPELIHRSPY